MSLDRNTLDALFRLSGDPVIAVKNGTLIYKNPAAADALGAAEEQPAADILPESILSETSDSFASAAVIAGREAEIRSSRLGGIAVYTLRFRPDQNRENLQLDTMVRKLGEHLSVLRLALDQLVARSGAEKDIALQDSARILYREYFRLKRMHSHLSLSDRIAREKLLPELRLLDLVPLVGDTCSTAESLSGGTIVFGTAETKAEILGDKNLLETMLLNLIANSLLYAGDSGVRVGLSQGDRQVVIAVDDTGGGMDAARLGALGGTGGKPDLTDPAAGIGLGLALVRGIALAHGGTVVAESSPDRGTRFRVSLPKPAPEERQQLCQPKMAYRAEGLDLVLTELSGVLDKEIYTRKFFD